MAPVGSLTLQCLGSVNPNVPFWNRGYSYVVSTIETHTWSAATTTDLHHAHNRVVVRRHSIRVPHIHKVPRARRILLRIGRSVEQLRDLRNRKVVERVLERARDLLRVRAAGLDEVLRDVPERLPDVRLPALQVPVRRLVLGVGEQRLVQCLRVYVELCSVGGVLDEELAEDWVAVWGAPVRKGESAPSWHV